MVAKLRCIHFILTKSATENLVKTKTVCEEALFLTFQDTQNSVSLERSLGENNATTANDLQCLEDTNLLQFRTRKRSIRKFGRKQIGNDQIQHRLRLPHHKIGNICCKFPIISIRNGRNRDAVWSSELFITRP